ncbi:MAG TPA: methyltransferase domain-containing protein [Methanospirillum sp.]|nr:methyltransferase domain-containing protein [Methanospirillum sp.]
MNSDLTVTPPTGGPTKDEILAISLFKLGLHKDDIFADLGCGTGRIAIEASSRVRTVHAVDKRPEACTWTTTESRKAGVTNLNVHQSENAAFLSEIDSLDTAFIGGSQGLDAVIQNLSELNVRTLVINAVMLETVYTAVSSLRKRGMFREVISANIARSYPIGTGIMFKPIDPVFIICGGNTC